MTPIEIFFVLWISAAGLCVGSFLNVVVLRGLSGESVIYPASHCPHCKNNLKWWMNIPVLSYIFLRGKCFYCKVPISIQYPIVEIVTGIFFLLTYLKFGITWNTLFLLIALSCLIPITVTDLKESVILDFHAYILIGAGFILNVITGGIQGALFSLCGAVLGFIVYEILAYSGYLFAGQRAFGEGDSLIAAGIGAFFGWKLMLLSVGLSVFVMSLFTFPYFLVYSARTGRKKTAFALVFALFIIILAYIVSRFDLIKTYAAILWYTAAIMAATGFCAYQILSDMKNKTGENSFCMLPFGPAMAASFVLIMFFKGWLISLLPHAGL